MNSAIEAHQGIAMHKHPNHSRVCGKTSRVYLNPKGDHNSLRLICTFTSYTAYKSSKICQAGELTRRCRTWFISHFSGHPILFTMKSVMVTVLRTTKCLQHRTANQHMPMLEHGIPLEFCPLRTLLGIASQGGGKVEPCGLAYRIA